jgi:HEPN domain-containing protein
MSPPENEPRLPGTAAEWLKHARSDIRLARLGRGHEDILKGQICFHAQQAAEKALKALLLSHSFAFPLTHDIEELLELAEQGSIELPAKLQEAGRLTPYAVETRYPGDWPEISDAEVDEAIKLADQIVAWVAAHLG